MRTILSLAPMFLLVSLSLAQDAPEEPLFVVHEANRWGYINREGKIVIPLHFSETNNFSEGLAPVMLGKGDHAREGYIDHTGKLVIPAKYNQAGIFSEGMASVAFKTPLTRPCVDCSMYDWHLKFGFIDKSGRIVIPATFRDARPFHEGLAAVQDDLEKWGFIDHSGTLVIPFMFDYASVFNEGLAPVMKGEAWGYVDKTGAWFLEPTLTSAKTFRNGVAVVRTGGFLEQRTCGLPCPPPTGGQWALLNKNSKAKVPISAAMVIENFSEGLLAYFSDENNCGYMDASGATVIQPERRTCSRFSEGLAVIDETDKPHYIDRSGKSVFRSPFPWAQDFDNGLARVGDWLSEDQPWGYIDHTGKLVWSTSEAKTKAREP